MLNDNILNTRNVQKKNKIKKNQNESYMVMKILCQAKKAPP